MSKALATKNVAAVLLALAMVFGFAFSFAQPAADDLNGYVHDVNGKLIAVCEPVAI